MYFNLIADVIQLNNFRREKMSQFNNFGGKNIRQERDLNKKQAGKKEQVKPTQNRQQDRHK